MPPADRVIGASGPRRRATDQLGKYELIMHLATGGMAEIYLARVTGLPGIQKMLVVKRILPQLAKNAEFVEMFLDEARIASTLQHPSIVQIYDVGVIDGDYFMTMEYLHGETVRALVRKNPKVPLNHALNIIMNTCAGLHYAHEKVGFDDSPLNIVHRDVSPQNLIVTYEGAVKLLDFGIAKASNRAGETKYGTLKGKIGYMSPEQCRSETLDRRSDIFSVGILLYELTLGRRLFEGSNDFEILKRIVEEPIPSPRSIDPEIPSALDEIIMRALRKDRLDRYQTAREMQVDLDRFARDQRLDASQLALQGFMNELFGSKLEAWRTAKAEGRTISEQIVAMSTQDPDAEDEASRVRASEQQQRVKAKIAALMKQQGISEADAEKTITEPSVTRRTIRRRRRIWAGMSLAIGASIFIAGVIAYWPMVHRPVVEPSPQPVAPKIDPPIATPEPSAKPEPPPPPTKNETVAPPKDEAPVALDPTVHSKAKRPPVHRPPARPIPKASASPAPTPTPPPEVKESGEGTLIVSSSPWCNVVVDGKAQGPTPITLKLSAGKHSVRLSNDEFHISRTVSVSVGANETVRKQFDFSP